MISFTFTPSLNTLNRSANCCDDNKFWDLFDAKSNKYTARFLIMALGPLNTPTLPNIPSINDCKGISQNISMWPHEPVGFETGNSVSLRLELLVIKQSKQLPRRLAL